MSQGVLLHAHKEFNQLWFGITLAASGLQCLIVMSVCCDIYVLDLLSLLFYLFNGVAGYVQVKCKNVEGILRGRLETLQNSQMSQGSPPRT